LLASGRVSTLAAAPEGAGPDQPVPPTGAPRRISGDALLGVCLSAGLVAVAFTTSSGVDQTTATSGNTWTEIVLTLLGAAAIAAAVLGAGRKRARAWGAGTVGLMAALTALTALSVIWSVVPDTSWSAANQMLSYLAVFAGAAALARLAPGRWPAVLGAIALSAVALSAWALLAKVFPDTLASNNTYGRLQAPFGYYNAVGIAGVIGLPACLWAGARRDAGRRVAGLAAPGIALCLSALVLSASRSADAAAVVVLAGWLGFVPLRLRSTVMLAIGGAGAAAVCAWALSHSALTTDGPLTPVGDSAGHTFGPVIAIVLVLVTVAGVASAWAMDHRVVAAQLRHRVGTGLVVLVCLIPVAVVGAVATSSRGLTGEISHAWTTLTNTQGGAANTPGRVLEFGSSRPLYWHQGLDVGSHALLKGAGASGYGTARLRYTTDAAKSDQAHSYIIETFADLGLIGVAVMLALLIAWVLAALRPLAFRNRWSALADPQRFEREAMAALAITAVGFGIQSALDWTWYFPGVAVPVLLCAGWLAGRGPLAHPVGWLRPRGTLLDRPGAAAAAAAVMIAALAGAWLQWQPQHSADEVAASLNASSNAQAFDHARSAVASDPLALQPRFVLASLYQSVNDIPAARAQLQHAVQTQPENPFAWAQLGGMDFQVGDPRQAISAMRHVVDLDHTSDPYTRSAAATIAQAQAEIVQAAAKRRAALKRSGRSQGRGQAAK
jgi:tetratricopeptide (TPR) repeat protein